MSIIHLYFQFWVTTLGSQKKPTDGTKWSLLGPWSCLCRPQFSRASCIHLCIISVASEFLYPTFLQDLPLLDVVLKFRFDQQKNQRSWPPIQMQVGLPSFVEACLLFWPKQFLKFYILCSQKSKTVDCIDAPELPKVHCIFITPIHRWC